MNYCSNTNCKRKAHCLRFKLGMKHMENTDYSNGNWRTRRQGRWVSYGSVEECDKCGQYIDSRKVYTSHPRPYISRRDG